MPTLKSLFACVGALCAALILAGCQQSPTAVTSADMAMGNPHASVTVVEYASVACPHCAAWNNTTFPAFKAKYIDTGKVRYVEREALTGDPAIAAAGFLTARCAGRKKYFQVVDAIYHGQEEMARTGDPRAVLLTIARSAGMTDAQFDACIENQAAINAINSRWDHYMKDDGITGTPTFVINGKTYPAGDMSMPQLDAAIAQAEVGAKGGS